MMKVDFTVKEKDGFQTGLFFQIAPFDEATNPNFEKSIVIHEEAFSLIERFWFEDEHPYAHWGNTYLNLAKMKIIKERLQKFKEKILDSTFLPSQHIHLMFKGITKEVVENFESYKNEILKLLSIVIKFLEINIQDKADGISVYGV
ncbi:hypothetical protein BKE30_15495 [Alkanindiges hydrocarboniclasticus]|uniref:Uncharacterized protein n=1 Tax=Alkanindiges hydrocarboniclasticus TaxID=1907941 RepID=A0A1S8CRA7_9GAMM|nr:hypothetical protein [Alkanindiges hydrocarboniclasticus]ONG37018.1 hypothetical protein BKE30_15495 [Alkanindiges hydrocarboniclasticus]